MQTAPYYRQQMEIIARNIRKLRLQRKFTVQELAYRCDMERSNLSRIEAGRANPTLRTLCTISRALEVPLVDLFR